LSNALNYSITLSLRICEKARIQPAFDLLMNFDGKVIFELSLLAFNIRKEVARILDSFLTFLRSYGKKKLITCSP
jgi:hypothetical protein